MNNFHTTAMCSPTRASLLTGRNHHSVGMGAIVEWSTGFPGYTGQVDKSAGTIAEMLGPYGYNNFAVGKWHMMRMTDATAIGAIALKEKCLRTASCAKTTPAMGALKPAEIAAATPHPRYTS